MIVFVDQLNDFIGMGEGILPAFQRGASKAFGTSWVLFYLGLTGEQNIAIEINAVILGIDDIEWNVFFSERRTVGRSNKQT